MNAPTYPRTPDGWTPVARRSIGPFTTHITSSYLAYVEVSGHLLGRPRATLESRIVTVNLVGCLAFGISAVVSYVVPSTGSAVNLAVVNTFTALGALCFLIGAILMLTEGARPPRHSISSTSGSR